MPGPRRPSRLHLLVVVLLGLGVYANTLGNGFHLDDHYRIVGNPELEHVRPVLRHFVDPSTSTTLPALEQYRPLLPLSLSLNYAVSDATGTDRLAGLHVGNALLHVLSSVLVYLFVRELFGARGHAPRAIGRDPAAAEGAARFASLLFAVHPVAGVPVNYLCARDLLLMQLFLLAALKVYARMRRRGETPLRWAGFLALLTLSLLSKTNAFVAPALVLAYELLLGGGARVRGTWTRTALTCLPPAGFLLFTRYALAFSDLEQLRIERSSALEYPLTQLRLHLAYYARNLVWPFRLRPLPAIEPAESLLEPGVLVGAAFVVGTLALAWRLRRRAPAVSFCVLAYWILMALTSSVIPLRRLATDYRQYASLPFAFAALALLVPATWGAAARRALGAAVVAAAAVVSVAFANPLWRDGRTLWGHSVRHGGSFRAHMNYASSLASADPERAEEHYRIALELSPGDVYSHIGLGMLLLSTGRETEGRASLERAVELAPSWAIAHHWLALGLERLDDPEGAAREAALAHQLDPRNAVYREQALRCHRGAAWEHYYAERFGEAREHVEAAARIEPPLGEDLFLAAFVRSQTGDLAGAVEAYRRYLETSPDEAQVLYNLGDALIDLGRYGEALEPLQRCLAVDPARRDAHALLAEAYAGLGDATRAAEHRAEWTRGTGNGDG